MVSFLKHNIIVLLLLYITLIIASNHSKIKQFISAQASINLAGVTGSLLKVKFRLKFIYLTQPNLHALWQSLWQILYSISHSLDRNMLCRCYVDD